MSWPWGTYLGAEALEKGIRAKISTWRRVGPNTIPHAAKATGVYLNSMLAVMEANRAGYEEALLLTEDGYVGDGSGENIFVVKDGVIATPDLSASILQGVTRLAVIQIARDLGYELREKPLIRTDLYMADELFMTGTAAEVTPIRAVDDVEIGDPGPVTKAIQETYLKTVTGRSSATPSGSSTSPSPRRSRAADALGRADPALAPVGWRERGGARPRGAPLRAARARAHDRALRARPRRAGRRALRGRGLERHGGAPPLRPPRRPRARRRGDHLAVLVRRLGELRSLRGRDAGLRRRRPA